MLLEAMQKVKEITAKYDPNVVKSYISVKETLQKINALRTLTTVKGTLVICHVSLVVSRALSAIIIISLYLGIVPMGC